MLPRPGLIRMLAGELVVGGNRFLSLPGLVQCNSVVFQHIRRVRTQRMGLAKEGQSFDQAAAAFQKSLALKQDQPEVLLALGRTQADDGKLSDVIQSFEKCLALKPDEFYATYNLGNAYYAQKDYEKAAASYEKAFAQKPDYPESLVGLGASQLAASKFDAAIATYQRLVPLKPEDANIRFNFGTALFNGGKYQDAATQYREAVRLTPAFAHAHYNLGMALLRLNDAKSCPSPIFYPVRTPLKSVTFKKMKPGWWRNQAIAM
jgi:tetratricopeptide (TPR) repeat protein